MAEDKTTAVAEVKWWTERDPVRKPEKKPEPPGGIIEKWAYELLKDYNQERAVKNVADINPRVLQYLSLPPGEWGYLSLEVGKYPPGRLAKIKEALRLPPSTRALTIDAGYSVRVLITGEPIGERLVDINFTEDPSLDFWVNGELVEERLFSSVDQALRKIRPSLNQYLARPSED